MAMNLQSRAPRNVDALRQSIEQWLSGQPAFSGRSPKLQDMRHIEGSGSNNESFTAILSVRAPDERHDVILRVAGKQLRAFLDMRMERQAAIIDWVGKNTSAPVATILAIDPKGEACDEPFMIMRRLDGNAFPDFPGFNVSGFLIDKSPDQRRRIWESGVDTMCILHRADARSIDFLDFPNIGLTSIETGLADLLQHWKNGYDWCDDQDIDRAYFDQVYAWLRRGFPADAPKGLSWGDARPGNMLFHNERCVAVLDWEIASLAGPLLDLAWWLLFDRIQDDDLGYKRLPGLGSREETLTRWHAGTGISLDTFRWHEVFAHFALSATRAKTFGNRRKAGMPVPGPDDARSLSRLQKRIDQLIG